MLFLSLIRSSEGIRNAAEDAGQDLHAQNSSSMEHEVDISDGCHKFSAATSPGWLTSKYKETEGTGDEDETVTRLYKQYQELYKDKYQGKVQIPCDHPGYRCDENFGSAFYQGMSLRNDPRAKPAKKCCIKEKCKDDGTLKKIRERCGNNMAVDICVQQDTLLLHGSWRCPQKSYVKDSKTGETKMAPNPDGSWCPDDTKGLFGIDLGLRWSCKPGVCCRESCFHA